MSCLIDTYIPTSWKKLATWWPDCRHDISFHNSKNCPQGDENKPTMEPKINCPWNNQDDSGQTIHDQFGDDCQSSLCCFCMQPRPSVYKSSCPLVVMGEQGWQGESQPLDRSLPPLPIAGIQNKANFPFHQPGLFIGFWGASSHPPLVTGLCHTI